MPAVRHCIARIDSEVQDRTLYLDLVSIGRPQIRARLDLDGDIRAEGALQKITQSQGQFIQINAHRVECLLPGKGEQPARKCRASFGCAQCRGNERLDFSGSEGATTSKVPMMTVRRLLKS